MAYIVFDERTDTAGVIEELREQGLYLVTRLAREEDEDAAEERSGERREKPQVEPKMQKSNVGFPNVGFPQAAYISDSIRNESNDDNRARARDARPRPTGTEEVAEFMAQAARELKVDVDPEPCAEAFIRYNDARGWRLRGGVPVADWTVIARQWVAMEPRISQRRAAAKPAPGRRARKDEACQAAEQPGAFEETGGFPLPEGMTLLEVIDVPEVDEESELRAAGWRR